MSEMTQAELSPCDLMRKRQFLLLQYLLGLGPSLPGTSISCKNLPGSLIKDVVFICIDTEFIPNGRLLCNQNFQFGMSKLDTQDLQSLVESSSSPSTQELCDLLATKNLCFGSSTYCSSIFDMFLFGKSETVEIAEVQPGVKAFIPDRDIILVTHGGHNDIKYLEQLEITIPAICTLDTQSVAQHPLQLKHRAGLRKLLVTLECPFQHMHVGGNDANFTLRVMLMLAIRNVDVSNCNKEQLAAISAYRAVAQSRRPRSKIESCN